MTSVDPILNTNQSSAVRGVSWSIIIPTLNRSKLLRATLDALLGQEKEIHQGLGEVLVADNRSIDDTMKVLMGMDSKGATPKYLPVSEEGACWARNMAARVSMGSILVFLDDDCVPQREWLKKLIEPIESGKADITTGTAQAFSVEKRLPRPLQDMRPDSEHPVVFECNFAIRKNLFFAVGGFDRGLGPHGKRWRTHEGRDLLKRARLEVPDLRWMPVPEAVVDHFVSTQSSELLSLWKRAWFGGVENGREEGKKVRGELIVRVGVVLVQVALGMASAVITRRVVDIQKSQRRVYRLGELVGAIVETKRIPSKWGTPYSKGTALIKNPKKTDATIKDLVEGSMRAKSICKYQEVWGETLVPMLPAEKQAPSLHPYFSQSAPYFLPSAWKAELEGALLMANPVGVITAEGNLIGEVSVDWGRQPRDHAWFRYGLRKKPEPLPGTSVLLASTGGESFYHWIIECLPRIALLEGVRPDRWIVNDAEKPFIRESLALAGVPADRIYSLSGKELLKCERLVVPSLPGPTGFPHPSAVAWLGGLFAENASSQKTRIRLCLVRTKNARRKWVPSPWLQKKMASAGYIFVSLESLKLQQQADLFRCASDIVAPHGAALAFLALCPEKTNVLELVPAGYPNPCFYRLSRIRRLQHTVLFSGSKERPPVWDLNPDNSDWPSESQIVDFL